MAWFDDLVTRAEKGSPLTTTEADNIITTLRSALPPTDSNEGKIVTVGSDVLNYESLVISDTYANISTTKTAAELKAGRWYLISDFQTIYNQHETATVKTAALEPLLVLAVNSFSFAPYAFSMLFGSDVIKYDFDITLANDGVTPIKGRIIERIDQYGNRTDYDHRKVLFPRWETAPASGIFTVITDNGGTMAEYLTFGSSYPSTTITINYVGDVYNIRSIIGQEFPNIVCQSSITVNNLIKNTNINNTFISQFSLSNISGEFNENTINQSDIDCFLGIFKNSFINAKSNGCLYNGLINGLTLNGNAESSSFTGDISSTTITTTVLNSFINAVLNTVTINSLSSSNLMGIITSSSINDIGNSLLTVEIISRTIQDIQACNIQGTITGCTIDDLSNCEINGILDTCVISDPLTYVTINGNIVGKTMNIATYPALFAGGYAKEIFSASDTKIYFSYFDGTNQVYTEIV